MLRRYANFLTSRGTQMRYILTAAALAATFAISTANAEPVYVQGGPLQVGSMCRVSTDGDLAYGYMAPCAPAPVVHMHKKKAKM